MLSCVQLFVTPWTWNSPGQNTGVGSHSLLQGIFPTQGSNPGLLHCRWILHQLRYQERNHKNYCETGTRSEGKILGFLIFFFFFYRKEFQRLSISSGHLAGLLTDQIFAWLNLLHKLYLNVPFREKYPLDYLFSNSLPTIQDTKFFILVFKITAIITIQYCLK